MGPPARGEWGVSPPNPTTFTLDNPTRDGHAFSIGLVWRALPGLQLGVGLSRNWFELVDIQTSRTVPPSNAKGHGGMTLVSLDAAWRF